MENKKEDGWPESKIAPLRGYTHHKIQTEDGYKYHAYVKDVKNHPFDESKSRGPSLGDHKMILLDGSNYGK